MLSAKRSKLFRWLLVLGASAILLPGGAMGGARTLKKLVRTRTADAGDLLQPLYRDVAGVLRSTQPAGDIVLLASPDASNSIGYYGRFKTIATLYWENVEGMKAASAIYGAEHDEDALELIRARGITHLAMVSKGAFLNEFFRLSRPDAPASAVEKTFGSRLLGPEQLPRWLKAIPYQPPANTNSPGLTVLLLQIVPEQSEFDAAWNLAAAQLARGALDRAEKNFGQAIASVARPQQAALYLTAADRAGAHQAIGLAIRFYRASLAQSPNPRAAGELAWLLSTTSDAALRNGREALALVEPVVRANPADLVLLNAFAGALAENGRFTDAAEVANRAITVARSAGDTNAAAHLQQRLDSYRANRPWRQ